SAHHSSPVFRSKLMRHGLRRPHAKISGPASSRTDAMSSRASGPTPDLRSGPRSRGFAAWKVFSSMHSTVAFRAGLIEPDDVADLLNKQRRARSNHSPACLIPAPSRSSPLTCGTSLFLADAARLRRASRLRTNGAVAVHEVDAFQA